ncbi:hypothetical protein QR680_011338 [Steinernema hermaphroditum]|uniref:E3 ubiquitin-protein ligase listerin n=1 Tax=Steinernema hermaphroditum TaxID=289476 RepID=A0AA39IS11_9BILA|nr:hypothetical protein QR680_011338 [Steinernema hermaphroditum]
MDRRRGGAKSASSSRAAELLRSQGFQVGFVGFGEATNIFQQGGADSKPSVEIDPEIRAAFGKLTKKDRRTREGALDSLAKILQVKNEEEVKCSFGYYVGNYSTFVTDCSAAFRAEANNVLKMYIRRLKKEIQEELKQILPLVLFSTYDAQNMVAKSAGAIFTECFDEEKRAKIRAAFASGTVSIAVQIINRSHKLVQPQKFTDEESDEDRVNRLVAQSLAALHDLGETADVALLQEMTTNSTTVSKLLSMPENVRSSLFLLFTRLLRADIEPFFATKVPSSVLSSLDSKNVALSRNAFECFLLFADAEQFYEVVKIEKAVIPKFVAMIRKKDRHWLVLEAYLLPSFALIYKHLPTEDHKSKLMRSIVESFFDGNVLENAFPVKSWSKAFGELVQFSFLNSSMKSDLDFLATKIFAYLDTVIDANDSESLTSAASLLSWLYKKDLATTEFRNTLELNMKNKLPSSATLLERFLPELEHQDRMIQESFLSCTAIPNSLLLKLLPFSQNKHDLLTPKDFAHRIEREENSDIRILLLNELIEFLNEYSCDETLDTLLRLESISTSCEVIASLAKNEKNWNDRILPAIPRVKSLNRVAGHILLHKEPSSIWIYWDDVVTALGFLRTDELNSFLEEWMPFIEPSHLERFADLLKEDSAELKNLNDHMRERAQIKLISLLIQQPTGVIASTQEIRKAIDVVTGFSSKPDSERLRDEIDGLMGFDLSTEHVRFAAEVILKCGLQDIMFTDQKHFNSFCEQLDIYSENFVAEGLELLPLLTNFKRRHEKLDVREYLRRAYFYALIIRDQPRTTNDMTFATVVVCAALGEFLVNKKLVPREWDEEIKESESWKTDFVMSIRPLPPQCSYYMAVRYLQGFAFRKTCIDVPIIKREFEKDHDEKYLALLVALKSFMRHQDIVPCQGLSEVAKAAWAAEFMSMRKGYSEETAVEYWELNNVGGDEADDEEDLRKLVETHGFDSFLFSYAKDSEDSVSHNILTSTYARLLSRLHATYLVEQENALCPDSRDFMDAALVTMLDVLSSADMNEKAAWIFDVYATMAARLYRRYIEDYIATASIELPSDHIRDCREAWRDFLFPTCSPAFVSYFLHRSNVHLGNAPHYLAVEVSRTVCSMKTAEFSFKDMNLPSSVDPTLDQLKYSEELQNVLAPVLGMICASPQAPVCAQLAAVQILKSLIPDMFAHENKENYDREKEGKCTLTKFKLPYVLEDTLKTINCTDQWQNIPPALLVWDALMDYALLLDVSEKFTFCRSLESDENRLQGELITILTTIYTKLPDSPALLEKTIRTKRVIVEESLILQDNCTGILFTQKPCHENFYHGHYYANLFYRTITAIPAHVRDWAKSLNKMHYAIVDKFIQQNISPLLIKHELQNMKAAAAADKKENLQIRIMPAIGQITAEYKFEDSSMVLNIVIPTDYPLSLPNVNYEKKMLEVQKQRKWLLQLIAFLTHQNGSMWDGVNQWRRSIEDHMEGVEECLICFSTVSADNFQLPKIQCKPCKKKFHGSCLYKWFESKDVPTCPHCRASFL